jgi:hypothetical protein
MYNDTPVVAEPYLNRAEAAEYLSVRLSGRITAQMIAGWGQKGPRFRLFRGNRAKRGGGWGRWAVYTRADLDAWIEAQLREPFGEDYEDADQLARAS